MDLAVAGAAFGAGCAAYLVAALALDETWRRWGWWAFGWFSAVATTTYGLGLIFVPVWESLQQPSVDSSASSSSFKFWKPDKNMRLTIKGDSDDWRSPFALLLFHIGQWHLRKSIYRAAEVTWGKFAKNLKAKKW